MVWVLPTEMLSQSAHKLRLKAQEEYDNDKYEKSEILYKKALADKKEMPSQYNLGNTLFKLKRYDEAADAYNESLINKADNKQKSNIFHNLGNTYYEKKKLKESIEMYKAALNLNPDRADTRKNLAIAKQKLKEQNQHNKSNKAQKENNDSGDKKTNDKQQNNSESKNSKQNQKISKSELEKLLKSVEEEEKEIQKRIIKTNGKSSKRLKDW